MPGARRETFHQGLVFSLLGHAVLAIGLLWLKGFAPSGGPMIIAAGPGEGGTGGAIEVGVVGASEWLRFYPEFDVATLGEDRTAPPAVEKITAREATTEDTAEPIPGAKVKKEKESPDAKTTDRPMALSTERPYAPKNPRGSTSSTSALIGIPGSPFPADVRGGVGIGVGTGGLAGTPGGSEYGRRLQQALIGYYRLTPTEPQTSRFVMVRVRLSRNGRVLSINNGQLIPDSFIQRSGNIVIDARVVGALLELDRHPIPFPPGFLPGAQEAMVEIFFQY